jgi:hypothetical protein
MATIDLINRVYKTLPEGARAQLLLCDAVFLLYTFSEHLAQEDPHGAGKGQEDRGGCTSRRVCGRTFNIDNLELLQGVAVEGVDKYTPPIIVKSEGALHFDHGSNHAIIDQCIRGRLTSVLVDTSPLPLEENIKETRRVLEMAHAEGGPARNQITQILREETQLFGCAGKAQEVRS